MLEGWTLERLQAKSMMNGLSGVFSCNIKSSLIPISVLSGCKRRLFLCSWAATALLIFAVYFVGSASLWKNNTLVLSTLGIENCMPNGSHVLPRGIVAKTSNLDMQPLWGPVSNDVKSKNTRVLLAMAVGIKQKSLVYPVVEKFLADDFDVMLFHYDGVVNEWDDLEWSRKVIHVSAANQTKLWFAKRFLHPDIVAEYEYIFLWDEDLGVEHFSPTRYLSIIREEGLEISQPALDARTSEVHHRITVRKKSSRVHRRYYSSRGQKCFANSTAPRCTGFVEIMAPVFSRAAWRCVWYMIQNDLIHGWGFDMKLGYCAQGDRTVKVGVVDEEYISHLGVPSLGGRREKKNSTTGDSSQASSPDSSPSYNSTAPSFDKRAAIRIRSTEEMKIFRKRWNKAVEEDNCWVDPFEQPGTKKTD